ncbi:hypothetical protein GUJ93_ZPchr0013g35500 [Zizania palustris]|uniref:Uncharacterized protein n=1 Tax=Zizania palustris TaxID=103762 RepID=A0A8J6C165_ZIZPA|nr:hypothetical protein GUJ93_ZPchr0013g35500 [Zizania palustris]
MQAVMPVLGWRWLLALSSVPCFILLVFFPLTPESPRYLCSIGKTVEATLILEKIARMNNSSLPPGILTYAPKKRVDKRLDTSETSLLIIEDNAGTDEDTSSKPCGIIALREFWSYDLIRSTFLLWFVYFANYFAYYGIILLTSELSNDQRRCASVGTHFIQSKDVNLYRDVLVTSLADLSCIVSQHWGRNHVFPWPDWQYSFTSGHCWLVGELPPKSSSVFDRPGAPPSGSGMCSLPSRDHGPTNPLILQIERRCTELQHILTFAKYTDILDSTKIRSQEFSWEYATALLQVCNHWKEPALDYHTRVMKTETDTPQSSHCPLATGGSTTASWLSRTSPSSKASSVEFIETYASHVSQGWLTTTSTLMDGLT